MVKKMTNKGPNWTDKEENLRSRAVATKEAKNYNEYSVAEPLKEASKNS